METIEYTRIDKESKWGAGPWIGEPDKVQFPDPETGLPCLAVRKPRGNWCGYVGVEPPHPLHGTDYMERDGLGDIHGGLTYSGAGKKTEWESEGICHVLSEGETDDVWWFGFDCAHYYDFVPSRDASLGFGEVYRDLEFVKGETAKLARVLQEDAA